MIVGGGWVLMVLGCCIHLSMVVGNRCAAKGVLGVWVLVVVEKKGICRGLFVNVALLVVP